MTRNRKDDWDRPRSKSQHLTPAEVQLIEDGFAAKRHPRDVARELKCATRTVYGYFAALAGKPNKFFPRRKKAKQDQPARHRSLPTAAPKPARGASRFYKSEFVPS